MFLCERKVESDWRTNEFEYENNYLLILLLYNVAERYIQFLWLVAFYPSYIHVCVWRSICCQYVIAWQTKLSEALLKTYISNVSTTKCTISLHVYMSLCTNSDQHYNWKITKLIVLCFVNLFLCLIFSGNKLHT